jgi:hypothetical protein
MMPRWPELSYGPLIVDAAAGFYQRWFDMYGYNWLDAGFGYMMQ